jgi:prepilin-type N-terminal cleavage/methylation domain-containing protein
MRKTGKINNQSAFTLIETLIALLILLVGLLAVAELFIAATFSNVFAQNTTIELKALENQMEELQSVSDWDPASPSYTTTPNKGHKVVVGGTVLMEDDGGPNAASLPVTAANGNDQQHVSGVILTPVVQSGRLLYLTPKTIPVSDPAWSQRRFEIRWQIVGYNAAGSISPAGVNLTDAYVKSAAIPNFATLLSSPTPPATATVQNSSYVLMRIAPIAADARRTTRIQIATILNNPLQ